MILVSSSGDHLDCFLAGDCEGYSCVDDSPLLAGTTERAAVGGTGATLVVTLDGADSDKVTEVAELVDWPSSSSRALSNVEISTVSDGTMNGLKR